MLVLWAHRAVVDGPHCRMQLSERALFCDPDFFLVKPAAMSAVIVDSTVHFECFGRKPF